MGTLERQRQDTHLATRSGGQAAGLLKAPVPQGPHLARGSLETDAEVKDLIFLAWWAADSERQLEGDRL